MGCLTGSSDVVIECLAMLVLPNCPSVVTNKSEYLFKSCCRSCCCDGERSEDYKSKAELNDWLEYYIYAYDQGVLCWSTVSYCSIFIQSSMHVHNIANWLYFRSGLLNAAIDYKHCCVTMSGVEFSSYAQPVQTNGRDCALYLFNDVVKVTQTVVHS